MHSVSLCEFVCKDKKSSYYVNPGMCIMRACAYACCVILLYCYTFHCTLRDLCSQHDCLVNRFLDCFLKCVNVWCSQTPSLSFSYVYGKQLHLLIGSPIYLNIFFFSLPLSSLIFCLLADKCLDLSFNQTLLIIVIMTGELLCGTLSERRMNLYGFSNSPSYRQWYILFVILIY